jgi:putative ABC transport system substrate-binding protein
MRRREFIKLAGGIWLSSVTETALGQSKRKPKVGYLSPTSAPDFNVESFIFGMRSAGFEQGRDYDLEVGYAERDYSRFERLISELLQSDISVLVTGGPASKAASFAAARVPVVFGFSGDPVEAGIVSSFARPGGNVTGVSFLALELAAKRVDVLKEIAPNISQLAILSNPDHAGESSELRVSERAAVRLGVDTRYFPVRNAEELRRAMDAIASSGCNGLITFPEALTLFHIKEIAAFAIEHKLPSMYGWRVFAQNGGLITYGPNLRDAYARLATYVVKILKGASPSSLPVEEPSRIETIVNLRTAKQIGLPISSTLLLRADEVIE